MFILSENSFYYSDSEIENFGYPQDVIELFRDSDGKCYGYKLYNDEEILETEVMQK